MGLSFMYDPIGPKESPHRMSATQEGNPPRCLMDFWAQRCLEEIKEAEEQHVLPHTHTTDRAMADTVMDFLFASQDATTAAVVWVTVLMAEYPDVLQKVRGNCHSCLLSALVLQVSSQLPAICLSCRQSSKLLVICLSYARHIMFCVCWFVFVVDPEAMLDALIKHLCHAADCQAVWDTLR